MQELIIDPEFKKLIAPLAHDEYKLLEASIIEDGCRDALVVWCQEGILVDGHHRHKICTEHGIEYETTEYDFDDRNDAIKWIYDNQLGRRNLTDEYRTYILGARYELEKLPHGGDRKSMYNNCTLNTRERLAGDNNVSEQTIVNAAKYKEAVDRIAEHSDELKDDVLSGKTKISKKEVMQMGAVCRDEPEIGELAMDEFISGNAKNFPQAISAARKQVDIKQQSELADTIEVITDYVHGDCLKELKPLKPDSIRLLLTDPPYGISYRSNRRTTSAKAAAIANDGDGAIDLFYDMLGAIHEAMMLECHLLVFTAWKVEHDFMEVLRSYGYDIRSSLVWVKENHTSGDLGGFAPKHERIIHATRGNVKISPRVADVLRFDRSYNTGHPTEKPVGLLNELINCTTSVGDMVVDPFAGTGATVMAATQLNRHVLGIEVESEWYNIGKVRLTKTLTGK